MTNEKTLEDTDPERASHVTRADLYEIEGRISALITEAVSSINTRIAQLESRLTGSELDANARFKLLGGKVQQRAAVDADQSQKITAQEARLIAIESRIEKHANSASTNAQSSRYMVFAQMIGLALGAALQAYFSAK